MIQTLWSIKENKYKERALEFLKKYSDLVNECRWSELASLAFKEVSTKISLGIIWSSIYNVYPDVFKELGYIPQCAFAYTNIEKIDLSYVERIGYAAFDNSSISEVILSSKCEEFNSYCFACSNQNMISYAKDTLKIIFKGTKKEFRAIEKEQNWLKDKWSKIKTAYVECTDGDITYGG